MKSRRGRGFVLLIIERQATQPGEARGAATVAMSLSFAIAPGRIDASQPDVPMVSNLQVVDRAEAIIKARDARLGR